jgi:MFS family permease
MMIVIGILAAFIVNAILASSGNWRLMLGLAAVPSLILLVGMLRMPETPRLLVKEGSTKRRTTSSRRSPRTAVRVRSTTPRRRSRASGSARSPRST